MPVLKDPFNKLLRVRRTHAVPMVVRVPPVLTDDPGLLQLAMSDGYSCGWAHEEIARQKQEEKDK